MWRLCVSVTCRVCLGRVGCRSSTVRFPPVAKQNPPPLAEKRPNTPSLTAPANQVHLRTSPRSPQTSNLLPACEPIPQKCINNNGLLGRAGAPVMYTKNLSPEQSRAWTLLCPFTLSQSISVTSP